MTATVLQEDRGAFRVLTLNRPDKRNALTAALLAEIATRLAEADAADGIAATVIAGAGPAFCAGFDMSGGGSASATSAVERARANLDSFLAIWRARKPVIAAVHGYALGAGCILACLCDLVIAAEDAQFGEPEIRYFNPASLTILPWLVGVRRARQMLFFGEKFDARTALDWGLVNRVLPGAGFLDAVLRSAAPLAQLHPAALAAVKRSINAGQEIGGFLEALRASVEQIAPLYEPDSPTVAQYRPAIAQLGLREYIRARDAKLAEKP